MKYRNFSGVILTAILLWVFTAVHAQTNTYRPLYHFTTDSNWINDPNGLVFYKGQYHLFSQYNPYSDKWGHMSWSHAVSTDLFAWKQLPLAIPEFSGKDSSVTMIFSGSAAVDSFNTTGFAPAGRMPLIAMYTGHVDKKGEHLLQHQNLAYSIDGGLHWQQYTGNPVLDIQAKEFRDPKIFWYEPGKKWIMVVVKPDQYKVMLYASANLKQWQYLNEFGHKGNVHNIWECPDLFEVPVEGSTEKYWVLTVSTGHPQKDYTGMQYFVGNFDGQQFTALPQDYPLYVDYGKDHYAGITYNNLPGKPVMISWASDGRYGGDIPTKGFRGLYTVPRTLQLRKEGSHYYLLQLPVKQLEQYAQPLNTPASFTLQEEERTLNLQASSAEISFDLAVSPGAEAGISVLKSGEEQTKISFHPDTRRLIIDRTLSGRTDFSPHFSGTDSVMLRQAATTLHVKILVDQCLVEVFADNGAYTLTNLVFPLQQQGNIALFARKGKAVFSHFSVKRIRKTLH